MKQLKVLALAALVALIAAPAFAADVDFSGQAAVDLGYSSSDDGSDTVSKMGIAQDAGAELKANASEGKLTAEWAVRVNAGGEVGAESGWAQYDFGVAQLKYNAKGADKRWNGDVTFFGDSAKQTLSVTAMDMIFVSLFDQEGGFANTDYKAMPAFSAGVDGTFGPASVKAGVAVDMIADKSAKIVNAVETDDNGTAADTSDDFQYVDGEEQIGENEGDAYTAFLAFVDTSMSFGAIGVNFAANYQSGGSALTGFAGGKDDSAYGVRVGGSYTMGNIEIGDSFGYSSKTVSDTDTVGMELLDFYVKYSLDDNFYVKPYATYDTTDEPETSEMKVAVRLGYSF